MAEPDDPAPPQDAAASPPAPQEPPTAPGQRADYVPARTEIARNLHGGIRDRETSCVAAMQDMLDDNPRIQASVEAATRRVTHQSGRDMRIVREIPDLQPDGTPKLILTLHDPETQLKLVINPHDRAHGFRLEQDDGRPPATLPTSAPPEAQRLNELTASGKGFQEIITTDPAIGQLVDRMFANADNVTPDHTASRIETHTRTGLGVADMAGLRKNFINNAITVFSVKDGLQSLSEGRVAQGLIDFVRLIPGVGLLATELLQTVANKMGLDVDPGMFQTLARASGMEGAESPRQSFNGLSGCGEHGKPPEYYTEKKNGPAAPAVEPATVDTSILATSLPPEPAPSPAPVLPVRDAPQPPPMP